MIDSVAKKTATIGIGFSLLNFGHDAREDPRLSMRSDEATHENVILEDDSSVALMDLKIRVANFSELVLPRFNLLDQEINELPTDREDKKPLIVSVNPVIDAPSWSQRLSTLCGIGAATLGSIAWIIYGRRGVPADKRSDHILPRLGSMFDSSEAYFPTNLPSLRMWVVNNTALALTGVSLALAKGNGVAGALYPAVTTVFALAVMPLARRYQTREFSNNYMKACEGLSYLSLGLYLASQFNATSALFAAAGVSGLVVSAVTGLGARALSFVPYVSDFIRTAANPEQYKDFPPLKNLCLWTGGTILSAASVALAVGTPYSAALIVPLGYMVQNILTIGLAGACYRRWMKSNLAEKIE